MSTCEVCTKRKINQRIRRRRPDDFIKGAYHGMTRRSRVRGWRYIVGFDEFYDWTMNNPDFWMQFKRWKETGYKQRFTPTVNRKDNEKSYLLENIEWIPQHQNSSLGSKWKHEKRQTRPKAHSKKSA